MHLGWVTMRLHSMVDGVLLVVVEVGISDLARAGVLLAGSG
jgi:hypothetical protein